MMTTRELWYDTPATTGEPPMASIYRRGGVWWCSFTGHNGKRVRRSTGTHDKKIAQAVASHWETQHTLVRAGLADPAQLLVADRGRTSLDFPALACEQCNVVRAFIAYAKLHTASDFASAEASAALERWLREERERELAAETVNKKLWAVQRYSAWLRRNHYIAREVLDTVKPVKPVRGEARRKPHDALTPAQGEQLFAGDFGLYYRFRCMTGLRGSEAALIERRDLDLGDSPTLHVRAEVAKNGYACTVPLARTLAEKLNGLAVGRLFPDVPKDRAKRTKLLRAHLDACGFGKEVNGRSLRMAHNTWLIAAGVELGIRIKLRRDKGRGDVKFATVTYSDPKQAMAVLREGVVRLEDWYMSQIQASRDLQAAGRAV